MRGLVAALWIVGCRATSTSPAPVPSEMPPPRTPPAPPVPSIAPELDAKCATDRDCAVTSLGDDCCDHCGHHAVSRASLARFLAYCERRVKNCSAIDCPYQPATAACGDGQCVELFK